MRTADEESGPQDYKFSSTGFEPNDNFLTETYVEFNQESLTEQRFTEDLDYDDAVISQTLFNAYRRRVDHSEGEGLSSSLSLSSMSHDRTGQPVVDRDKSHESNHGPVECSSSNTRQLGCVFQDMEPPKLTSILRKSSDMQKPIQRVKFTKAIARHTKIRDQNPSLGLICPGEPHQRSSNAPKFEDRSQEETEWQEQGAREAAWKLAKSVLEIKGKTEQHYSHLWEMVACEEFVVDSGASMHMISKKDLSDAEMDTLTKSCSPTIVITAHGEVQTHEEATVYVKELDIFLTMKVLQNTPAILSLGKFCDENGYSYEWMNGQKPHLILNGIRIQSSTENFVPIVVPGLSTSSSSGSYHSTSRTPSRQERHCSTSSSSSSSSPTATSSDNETREREDRTESDASPVPVSNFNVDDRTGQPVVDRDKSQESGNEIQRQNSENEQIRTLLDRQRDQSEIRKHEFQVDFENDRVAKRRSLS